METLSRRAFKHTCGICGGRKLIVYPCNKTPSYTICTFDDLNRVPTNEERKSGMYRG